MQRKPKTATAIWEQKDRLYRRACQRTRRMARLADPRTDGNQQLVHNWGNAEAKAAQARGAAFEHQIVVSAERLYDRAEHRDRHGPAFRPLWCEYCGKQLSAYYEPGPEDGDYTITPGGSLGGLYCVGIVSGPYVGEWVELDDATAAIRARMDTEKFWPNVWFISDHGNVSPVTLE